MTTHSHRGICLLPEPEPISPAFEAMFKRALAQHGPLQLSVLSPIVPNMAALEHLEQSEDISSDDLAANRWGHECRCGLLHVFCSYLLTIMYFLYLNSRGGLTNPFSLLLQDV